MADEPRPPLFRRRWWLGVVVGLVLPVALVPASVQLMRWFGHWQTIGDVEGIAWIACAAIGVFLVIRPWLLAVPLAAIYSCGLAAVLVFLHLGVGCAVLGGYACP